MKNSPVKVISNHEVAPNCFRIVLSGSFEDFILKPGQFIMLRVGVGYDPLLRRPFAAHRSKTSEGIFLEIFYQVVGYGTQIMSHMLPGTELELLGPLGNGFEIPAILSTALVVAGGIGIVPLRGLIHHLVELKIKNTHVFVGAQSGAQLLFQPEFQKMDISLHLATEDGSLGNRGLVTDLFQQFLENHPLKDENRTMCFACGPRPLLAKAANLSLTFQLPCQVSLESRMACGIGVCLGCAVKLRHHGQQDPPRDHYGRVCLEGPVFDAKEIEW